MNSSLETDKARMMLLGNTPTIPHLNPSFFQTPINHSQAISKISWSKNVKNANFWTKPIELWIM